MPNLHVLMSHDVLVPRPLRFKELFIKVASRVNVDALTGLSMYCLRCLCLPGENKPYVGVETRDPFGRTMGVCGPEVLVRLWAKPFHFPGVIPFLQFVAMMRRFSGWSPYSPRDAHAATLCKQGNMVM